MKRFWPPCCDRCRFGHSRLKWPISLHRKQRTLSFNRFSPTASRPGSPRCSFSLVIAVLVSFHAA
eukprot:8768096-Pyramimonas_sp.AAC.1